MIYVPAPTDKQQLRLAAEQHFICGFFGLLGEQTEPSPLHPSPSGERGGGHSGNVGRHQWQRQPAGVGPSRVDRQWNDRCSPAASGVHHS